MVNNSSRYECNITSTNQTDLTGSVTMNIDSRAISKLLCMWNSHWPSQQITLLVSSTGFCDHDMVANTPHGNYSWMETIAEENATSECFYEPTREAGPEGRATRKCGGPRMWLDYYGGECITVITFRFRQLANVSIVKALIHLCHKISPLSQGD